MNSVPFETYLTAVVPSEMPSTYEKEALKAQAVCARSYAYIQLMRADLAAFGAHINDSTSYQVYNKVRWRLGIFAQKTGTDRLWMRRQPHL